MIVKKINAICTWILAAALIVHVSTTVCYMLTGWYILKLFIVSSRIVAGVCFVHICISVGVMFFMHDGTDLGGYGRLNMRTVIQRTSGLVILLFVHPHIMIFESFIYESVPLTLQMKIVTFVVEALFFGAIFTHLDRSFSRSLITMGMIRTDNAEKRTDLLARIVSVAGCAASVIALGYFLINWPAA